jgi:hypothetical protein
MLNTILLSIGGFSVLLWGISHLFPTRSVVNGFGDISTDNRRIILMEWVAEGLALIFIGVLVLLVTFFGDRSSSTAQIVFAACSSALFALAILSLFTGARIKFLPFRLCPVIFTVSAILIQFGAKL